MKWKCEIEETICCLHLWKPMFVEKTFCVRNIVPQSLWTLVFAWNSSKMANFVWKKYRCQKNPQKFGQVQKTHASVPVTRKKLQNFIFDIGSVEKVFSTYFFGKLLKNNFLSNFGAKLVSKNGKLFAGNTMILEGRFKVWEKATTSPDRSGYPEKTTQRNLQSIALFLTKKFRIFADFVEKKFLKNIFIQNSCSFKSCFFR